MCYCRPKPNKRWKTASSLITWHWCCSLGTKTWNKYIQNSSFEGLTYFDNMSISYITLLSHNLFLVPGKASSKAPFRSRSLRGCQFFCLPLELCTSITNRQRYHQMFTETNKRRKPALFGIQGSPDSGELQRGEVVFFCVSVCMKSIVDSIQTATLCD